MHVIYPTYRLFSFSLLETLFVTVCKFMCPYDEILSRSMASFVTRPITTRDVIYFLQGPTEAERKIEELTRQLEEEMEKQEEEGEYFGKNRTIIQNNRRTFNQDIPPISLNLLLDRNFLVASSLLGTIFIHFYRLSWSVFPPILI